MRITGIGDIDNDLRQTRHSSTLRSPRLRSVEFLVRMSRKDLSLRFYKKKKPLLEGDLWIDPVVDGLTEQNVERQFSLGY